VSFTPSGTQLPAAQQTPGDCQVLECDGNGSTMSVADNTDLPVDNNQCTADLCTNGVPSNPALAPGMPCTQNGGTECDGIGDCVQCLVETECPGQDTACETRTCNAGTCGLSFATSGTPLPAAQQTPGDCQVLECDGSGGTMPAVDNTDVPVDNNQCTADVCTNGVPSNPKLPEGTQCTQNAGEVCDPNAKCNRLLAYVQFGDGVTPRTSAAAAVFVDHVYVDGTPGPASIALPTAANPPAGAFTNSGSASSEGHLARSVDTHFLTLAGYNTPPGTLAVAGTTSATVNRVVARINATGTIDTTTLLAAAFSANNPRSAVTIDGSAFWVSGAGGTTIGGVWYVPLGNGTSATQITGQVSTNPPNNARVLGIFGNQLFGDAITTGFDGPFSIAGSPPPTVATAATLLSGTATSGTGTPSPYGFVLFDLDPSVPGLDTLYLADDRTTANGGGIQKWQLGASMTWTLTTTFNQGLTAGCRGLTGWLSGTGTNVVLAATTADTTAQLVVMTDDGSATPAFTTLATAAANTTFRGVALAPK
jgi:hypothetical protein